LELNSKHLSNPHMINTVIHEMQHRAQYTGMGFRFPWAPHVGEQRKPEPLDWDLVVRDINRLRQGY
ncbi:MAG TPA: hypothetical protein PLA44_12785, partial [Propionibacteriaceae bacterium]|nr:hypothetical protein [Propionibacteriaceae bacterium]